MPIPKAMLLEAQRPLEDRILDLLKKSPEVAFTASEICASVEGIEKHTLDIAMVFGEGAQLVARTDSALEKLISMGKVDKAKYQGNEYFILHQ